VSGILPAGRRWLALRENGDGEREEEEDMVIAGPPVGAAAMAAAAAEDGYFGRVMSSASLDKKDTKFTFRCFNCGIGRRSWSRKTFCIKFEMVN